jgi:hypothetical protein
MQLTRRIRIQFRPSDSTVCLFNNVMLPLSHAYHCKLQKLIHSKHRKPLPFQKEVGGRISSGVRGIFLGGWINGLLME